MSRTFTVALADAAGTVILSAVHHSPPDAARAFFLLASEIGALNPLNNAAAERRLLLAWLGGETKFEVLASDFQHTIILTINE